MCVRIGNATSCQKGLNLKSIFSCLMVVVCLVVLSILSSVYIFFNISKENRQTSSARLFRIWILTIYTMNCTFNSLIFFWKYKLLRSEGVKILIEIDMNGENYIYPQCYSHKLVVPFFEVVPWGY